MLFSKPLLEIDEADLQALCNAGYPETEQVEYKEFLPGRSGPDAWHDGAKSFADYARDQLFAEIVAFANTRGGHLLLGIEESSDSSKRAVSVKPIRDCHELATRLSQAAFACIEPTLSELQIVGVPVGHGGNGVILFRVRQSHSAPHRLIKNRHCYYRRAESTVTLNMREIQDLTLNTSRGLQHVEERLTRFREEFYSKANLRVASTSNGWVGSRVTAVPLTPLRLGKEQVRAALLARHAQFDAHYRSGRRRELFVKAMGFNNKPVLRGTQIYNHTPPMSFEHSAFIDGSQSLTTVFVHDIADDVARGLSLNEQLGAIASVLCISEAFAAHSSMPAAEFAVEVEIASTAGAPHLYVMAGTTPSWTLDRERLLLPQYSYIPESGLSEVLNLIQGDLFNCAGQSYDDHLQSIRVIT
jgi:Putative DNA-binding domain